MSIFRKRSLRFSVVVGLASLLVGALSVAAAPAQHSTSSVHVITGTPLEGPVIPGTSSTLVRTDSGVSMTLKTVDLPAGSVQTTWWVVFNNPEECSFGDGVIALCAEMDLFVSPDALPSVMYASGRVIDGSEKGNFAAHLSLGDISGCHLGPIFSDPALADLKFPCNPLVDARGAEIHIAVHDHGTAVPGMIADMLSTFDGGCINLGRGTGPNTCSTTQVAPHTAP